MLYCRNCGQCSHIGTDRFIEFAHISGTETRYLDPDDGEVEDYGDTDTDSTGDSDYSCPHCESGDIDFESNIEAEEAFNQRAQYEKGQVERKKMWAIAEAQEKTKKSDWDLEKNLV